MPYKDKEQAKAYLRQYGKETRQWCRENGICIVCEKEKADAGYTSCLQCRMADRERTRVVTNEQRERHAEMIKQRQQRLQAAGLCEECGKRPRGQYRRCEVCRARSNAKRRKKQREAGRLSIQDRWNGQQCGRCMKPTEGGAKLCPECLAKMPKGNGSKNSGFAKGNALFWDELKYRKGGTT